MFDCNFKNGATLYTVCCDSPDLRGDNAPPVTSAECGDDVPLCGTKVPGQPPVPRGSQEVCDADVPFCGTPVPGQPPVPHRPDSPLDQLALNLMPRDTHSIIGILVG